MIPAPKDSTEDPDAGAAPTVTGQDRIGAAPDGTPQTGPVTDELPAPLPPPVAPEPTVFFASPVISVPVDRLPSVGPGAISAPPPSPDVTIRALEPASHRPALSDSAPAVRPVTSGLERPVMVPPPSPRLDPRLESTRVEPMLTRPTAALTPPVLMPVAPHHPPTAVSPADEPTIFAPPPPRRQPPPPPPPVGGLTPPPPPPAGGRKPLVGGGADRPPQQPQYVPMPSTIAPTEPQRKRSRFRSKAARSSVVVVFDGVMSLATIVALILWVGAFAGLHEFDLPGPLQAAKVVVIPPKKTRDEIGDILEQNGVVSNGTVFVYGSMIAQVSELKAGEYEFHPGATMRDVAEEIQQNKVVQHKITFPEGWTSEQIVQRLIDDPVLAGKVVAIPEEGSLLPDTYTYPRGETRQQILDRMHKNLDRRLTDIWAHRNADALKQLKVPKDLVILASIIEKETSKPDERARIAAVFVNRLNRNMRLETDPTILYGLYGGKAWTEPRTITKADLAAPNPYNTYKINGLPPGPIGNPGRASLEAAANPLQSNELFFVADGTGGHAFAETLDEHNKNVARWREIERQRKLADPNSNAPLIPGSGTGLLAAPAVAPPAAVTPGLRQPATQRPTTTTRPRPRVTVPADQLPADVN